MPWSRRLSLIVILSAAMPLLGLGQPAATTWLDTFESRLEILALTQTLNAEIMAGSSATQSLEKWCRDHKMAADPIIVARLIPGGSKAPTNQLLETSQTPFGKAVQSQRPYRRTFAVTLLWSPLPSSWEQQRQTGSQPSERARPLVLPKELFEHRAILYTSEHQPISEVHERYQGQLLAFPRGQ